MALSNPPILPVSKSAIQISEVAVSILARLADQELQRESLSRAGVVSILVAWLNDEWSGFPRVQEAALDALASMCKSNGTVCQAIINFKGIRLG
jgi:armadillo repeat-containing protein 8